jgi:hypothetical protein
VAKPCLRQTLPDVLYFEQGLPEDALPRVETQEE